MGSAAQQSWRHHFAATVALAAPIALAWLSQMAMGLTDTVMLGGIGTGALAAGGLGANLFFTGCYILACLPSGVPVLAAQALGGGRPGEVPAIYWTGMALAVAVAVPFFWASSHPGPLLRWLGEPAQIGADVAAYLAALRWGGPAALVGFGVVRGILPALGLQRLLLWVLPAGVGVNAGLNLWLIHGGLGLPALGLRGSGYATAITQWLVTLALLALLHGRREGRARLRLAGPRARVLGPLLGLGLPTTGLAMAEATLFSATGVLIGRLGAEALAAHMVALSVASFTFMLPFSVGLAANVRVASAFGAGRMRDVQRAGYAGLALSVALMGASGVVLLTAPGAIVGLYMRPGPAARLAAHLLRIAALFQVADGTQTTAANALRGLSDTRVPLGLAVFGYWGVGFALGYALAFPGGLGAVGLWYGLLAGLAFTAVALAGRFVWLTAPPAGRGGSASPAPLRWGRKAPDPFT